MSTEQKIRSWQLFRTFTWLGWIGFGGPAAHIGLMNRELVKLRGWVSEETFYGLIAFTNLLPGPNSTQLAMAIGYEKAGWRGLWLSGLGFIWPAVLLTGLFAAGYSAWVDSTLMQGAMLGIQAVLFAVIVWALLQWGKTIVTRDGFEPWDAIVLVGFVAALDRSFGNELIMLAGALGLGIAWKWWKRNQAAEDHMSSMTAGISLLQLIWSMTKIGSVLYGSGYVLFPFLKRVFVDEWQVLDLQTISDAIAVGQLTPGPLFASATYVGYVLHGVPGAIVATIGIFLPAFLVVALLIRRLVRWQQIQWVRDGLEGVQYASFYLLAMMCSDWALTIFGRWDGIAWVLLGLAMLSFGLMVKYGVNSVWLLLAGGVLGAFLS